MPIPSHSCGDKPTSTGALGYTSMVCTPRSRHVSSSCSSIGSRVATHHSDIMEDPLVVQSSPATADLAYLLPTVPSHSLHNAIARRPRSPFYTCPCQAPLAHRVYMRSLGDDGKEKKEWFGMQPWFGQKDQQENAAEQPNATSDGSKQTVGSTQLDTSGPPENGRMSDLEMDANGEEKKPFRWPWQKDEDVASKSENKSKPVRKVGHSDNKPGAFGKQKADTAKEQSDSRAKKQKEEELKAQWQEKWPGKVISVIAPGFSDKDKDKSEEDKQSKKSAEDRGSDGKRSRLRKISSVFELYKPPLKQKPMSKEDRSSFRWPWKREEAEGKREEKGVVGKAGKNLESNNSQSGKWKRDENNAKYMETKKQSENVKAGSSSPGIKEGLGGKKEGLRWPWQRDVESDEKADGEETAGIKSKQTAIEKDLKSDKAEPQRSYQTPKVKVTIPLPEGESLKENMEKEAGLQEVGKEKKREAAVALRSMKSLQKPSPHIDIVTIPQRDIASIRLIFGSETFFATETLSAPGGLVFRGNLRGEPNATLKKLEERLAARLGNKYTLCLAEGEEDLRPVVVVVPTVNDMRTATPRQKLLAVMVAFLTASTCVGRGLYTITFKETITRMHGRPGKDEILYRLFGMPSWTSVTIAVSIGLCVVISQIVQRIVASRRKTRIAIPFILPSYQLGSFGAVVQIASPTPTRAALFDIALSGAATMALLSLGCLVIGLRLSTSLPFVVPVPMSTVSSSVVMGFLTQQIPNGKILMDYSRSLIGLHPLAVIGANCLTIAALNLLPMRQLDGGRIISALYGRKTAVAASRMTVFFLLLASSKNAYLIVFLAAITFGPWTMDRPARNELTEPDGVRTIVGYLLMLLMIGVLLPFPACKFFGTL